MTTANSLLRTLRSLGFNVTGNTGFRKDVRATWVCTDKGVKDVYIRPDASSNHHGNFAELNALDEALSIEMVTALAERGFTCYSRLYYARRGMYAVGPDTRLAPSADFYVCTTEKPVV